MTATLKIKHSGIIKAKSNWTNWEYTQVMAKALETSELAENILTISANAEETSVTLLDPLLARSLLASRDRIEV